MWDNFSAKTQQQLKQDKEKKRTPEFSFTFESKAIKKFLNEKTRSENHSNFNRELFFAFCRSIASTLAWNVVSTKTEIRLSGTNAFYRKFVVNLVAQRIFGQKHVKHALLSQSHVILFFTCVYFIRLFISKAFHTKQKKNTFFGKQKYTWVCVAKPVVHSLWFVLRWVQESVKPLIFQCELHRFESSILFVCRSQAHASVSLCVRSINVLHDRGYWKSFE